MEALSNVRSPMSKFQFLEGAVGRDFCDIIIIKKFENDLFPKKTYTLSVSDKMKKIMKKSSKFFYVLFFRVSRVTSTTARVIDTVSKKRVCHNSGGFPIYDFGPIPIERASS